MPFLRVHRALVVAVVVAAMAAGLASAHGAASAQAPATDTVTTPLQPGWNLVGWMGPDTTPADLFRDVRLLQVVAVWDEDAGRYAWARRRGAVPPPLERITRGQGLFLWVGGTRSVQWTRPASVEGMLLTLPTGYSLVGWAGLDGTPISEAVGRFGSALVGASWWNAATQSYERYEPGVEEPAEGMATLNHGDALWVELSEERRWWQSGTARTEFAFEGAVTPVHESELRAEMERVVAFFAERYGIEPPEFAVRVAPQGPDTGASRGLIHLGPDRVHDRSSGFVLAHEYFHVLQFHLSRQPPSDNGSPAWLTEGTATYAAAVYGRELRGKTDDGIREVWALGSLDVTGRLSDFEASLPFYDLSWSAYQLGAMAVDWLVRHATALSDDSPFTALERGGLGLREDYDAHFRYYRVRQPSVSWRAAFEEAFGIGVDEFYGEFAEYRKAFAAAHLAHLPHIADELDEPILVLAGDIPTDTADRIRAQFDALQVFFRDRLGGGPADYTVFVASDQAAAASIGQGGSQCGSLSRVSSLHILACDSSVVTDIAWQHFLVVRDRLAPTASLPFASEGYGPRGASWLGRGLVRYVEGLSRAALGVQTLSSTWRSSARRAGDVAQQLRDLATSAGLRNATAVGIDSLFFLAADWLVERAGERSLFEYYRLLPSSDSWQEAFEGTFGITIDDFYAAFEAYRAAGFTS